MILTKTSIDKLLDIKAINLSDKKSYEAILNRHLTKSQLSAILQKIKATLKNEKSAQILCNLNNLRRQLRSRYSINLSNDIIDDFLITTEKMNSPRQQLDFDCIDREIKMSLQQINKKKYCMNSKLKKETFTRKIISAEKRKRKNIFNNITCEVMPQIRSIKNFDQIFIKDKLVIFKEYLEQDEIDKIQGELKKKVEAIEQLSYGKYADRIKHYTIFDHILQRIFSLVQEDTKNIEIRNKFKNIYKKMKEEMVQIVTNEEEVTDVMKKLKSKALQNSLKTQSKPQLKKNYFQLDREKQDLALQIQQTLQAAKKNLKEAFLKKGRPDYAYEMELLLQNRKTPTGIRNLRI